MADNIWPTEADVRAGGFLPAPKPSTAAALPEIRVEEMPCHLHGTDYRAECEFCQGAYADREMENLRADRDRLQRRVAELTDENGRLGRLSRALAKLALPEHPNGGFYSPLDAMFAKGDAAKILDALTSETPHAK